MSSENESRAARNRNQGGANTETASILSAGGGTIGAAPSTGGQSPIGGAGGLNGVERSRAGATFGTTGVYAEIGCGTAELPVIPTPFYLVLLYDKSGSMGVDPNGQWANADSRWVPLKQGVLDFLKQSATQAAAIGIQISMTYFPASGDTAPICQHDYARPDVAMTPLQDAQPLVAALENATPGDGTPMLSAVIGGVSYAQQLVAESAGSKAALVLVTDGELAVDDGSESTADCAPATSTLTNTIPDIAKVVQAAYRSDQQILTYVIGIGDISSAMNQIAKAGGTSEMIGLDPNDPVAARAQLTQALLAIRSKRFNCSLPTPKNNFVPNLVNLYFKHANGTLELIRRSQDCSLAGWYFEPEANPTKAILCPTACESLKQDLNGLLVYQQSCHGTIL